MAEAQIDYLLVRAGDYLLIRGTDRLVIRREVVGEDVLDLATWLNQEAVLSTRVDDVELNHGW